MPCRNCSSELPKDAQFCPQCATPLELPSDDGKGSAPLLLIESEEKTKRPRSPFILFGGGSPEELDAQIKRKKQHKLISVAVTLAVCLILLLSLYLWWTSASQRIKRSLNDDKLNQAISIYQEELKQKNAPKEKALISEALDTKINDALEKYYRGALKLEEVKTTIDEIATVDFYLNPQNISSARDKIERRELSKAAYASGLAQIERKDYVSAMQSLAQVDEDDPNYEQAQIQLDFATKSFVDHAIQVADERSRAKNFTAAIAKIDKAIFLPRYRSSHLVHL